ncbi:hypothetical protein [Marinivivus vitaminiproducens]|uniref:hypothetical protein n=1 Tax=Marinivivus vitaminiproducens TaxID=3035935 RepID=UPI0027AB91A5|nr:hypothetical protein P4R82_02675 [Geminicoccaceae bacterium SCSIO 64248]
MRLASRADAECLIHDAVHRVLYRAKPAPTGAFFAGVSVAETLTGLPAPTHDPDLWWRAVVDQIQEGLVQEGLWADGLSVAWLKRHAVQPWASVRDFVLARTIAVDE